MTAPPDATAPVVGPTPPRLIKFRSVAVTGLFVLAVFYTLHLGRPFFLPLVLAFLLFQKQFISGITAGAIKQ